VFLSGRRSEAGRFRYRSAASPEDTASFDEETINEIETVKWHFRAAGITAAVQYLRCGRWCIIMATGDRDSFFDSAQTRTKEFRPRRSAFAAT